MRGNKSDKAILYKSTGASSGAIETEAVPADVPYRFRGAPLSLWRMLIRTRSLQPDSCKDLQFCLLTVSHPHQSRCFYKCDFANFEFSTAIQVVGLSCLGNKARLWERNLLMFAGERSKSFHFIILRLQLCALRVFLINPSNIVEKCLNSDKLSGIEQ